MHELAKTFAEGMPDRAVAKYFDPEYERQRQLVHDYQQTELEQMRRVDNTKLAESIDMLNKMLSCGLYAQICLNHFIALFVGD